MGGAWGRQDSPLPARAAGVKVVTYNVLASCFAHYLRYVPQRYLQFEYRRRLIVSLYTG